MQASRPGSFAGGNSGTVPIMPPRTRTACRAANWKTEQSTLRIALSTSYAIAIEDIKDLPLKKAYSIAETSRSQVYVSDLSWQMASPQEEGLRGSHRPFPKPPAASADPLRSWPLSTNLTRDGHESLLGAAAAPHAKDLSLRFKHSWNSWLQARPQFLSCAPRTIIELQP